MGKEKEKRELRGVEERERNTANTIQTKVNINTYRIAGNFRGCKFS